MKNMSSVSTGLADEDLVFDELQGDALTLARSLDSHMRKSFSPDAGDRPLRQPDRERGGIDVGRLDFCPFSAPRLGATGLNFAVDW